MQFSRSIVGSLVRSSSPAQIFRNFQSVTGYRLSNRSATAHPSSRTGLWPSKKFANRSNTLDGNNIFSVIIVGILRCSGKRNRCTKENIRFWYTGAKCSMKSRTLEWVNMQYYYKICNFANELTVKFEASCYIVHLCIVTFFLLYIPMMAINVSETSSCWCLYNICYFVCSLLVLTINATGMNRLKQHNILTLKTSLF
jgi:hypothetical protein